MQMSNINNQNNQNNQNNLSNQESSFDQKDRDNQTNQGNEVTDFQKAYAEQITSEARQNSISKNMYTHIHVLGDSYRTLTREEMDLIDDCKVSERQITKFLSKRRIIRGGLATMSYFSMYDAIITKRLHRQHRNLAALLQNTPYIKQILMETLGSIPQFDPLRDRNRGFLKSHMAIERARIEAQLSRIIKDTLEFNDPNAGGEVAESLKHVLLVLLMHQFAKNHLIDYSELSISLLTPFNEDSVVCDNLTEFSEYIISEYVHQSLMSITRVSESIADVLEDKGDKGGRGIDFITIINQIMPALDQMSQYLIKLDYRESMIKDLFVMARLYRDKIVFDDINEFSEIMSVVTEFVQDNENFFSTLLNTYEFNEWMDAINSDTINSSTTKLLQRLLTQSNRYRELMAHMSSVLQDPRSILTLMDKEDFIQNFDIHCKMDKMLNKNILCTIYRKYGQINGSEIYEMLVQTHKPFKRMVNSFDQDAFILISGKFYSKAEYESMIDDLHKLVLESEENSYAAVADAYLPSCFSDTIHNYLLIQHKDISKLACCFADKVIKMHEFINREFIESMNSVFNDNLIKNYYAEILNTNPEYVRGLIYIKDIKHLDISHKDVRRRSKSNNQIMSRDPRRIIEDLDSVIGSKHTLFNSNLINASRAYATQNTMKEEFQCYLSHIDTNSLYEIKLSKGQTGYYTDLVLSLNTDEFWKPLSNKDAMVVPLSPYKRMMNLFEKSMNVSKLLILEYSMGSNYMATIDADMLKSFSGHYHDVISQYSKYVISSSNEPVILVNDSLILDGYGDLDTVYKLLMPADINFECGLWKYIRNSLKDTNDTVSKWFTNSTKNLHPILTVEKALPELINNVTAFNNNSYSLTYEANLFAGIFRRLNTDSLFSRLVKSMKIKSGDENGAGTYQTFSNYMTTLSLFEKGRAPLFRDVLQLSIASIIIAYLHTITLGGGDTSLLLGSASGDHLLYDQSIYANKIILMRNPNRFDRFNASMFENQINIINSIADENLIKFFHSEIHNKQYMYDILNTESNETQFDYILSQGLGDYTVNSLSPKN